MKPDARPWTAEEDAELRRLAAMRVSSREIAIRFGRTLFAIHNRRVYLDLGRWRRMPAESTAKVESMLSANPKLTNAEVARCTGRSISAVARARQRLGLPGLTRSEWTSIGNARRSERIKSDPHAMTSREARVLAALECGPLAPVDAARTAGLGYVHCHKLLLSLRSKGRAFAEGRSGRGYNGEPGTKWYSVNWWLVSNDKLILHTARMVHRKVCNCRLDFEDIASVVRLQVTKCARAFRPRGVKFCTYALTAAHHAATAYCLTENNRGIKVTRDRLYEHLIVPVASLESMTLPEGERFEPAARESADAPPMAPDFWVMVASVLPHPISPLIVGHYRDGLSLAELGRDVLGGMSHTTAANLIRKGEELLRASGVLAEFAPEAPR